ncbi:glycerophosphodiester phosphodiesterase family protein [Aeromicrobium sp. UC242_57]|uniref:glycerophosphodiester phosphodiesterase family protein n=1 Tax=Aeromicrobium sp. UC242_57 TaxID=3374624 RepID=UPI0037AC642F
MPHTGWFTEDFTLEEIKTLRVRERLPQLRPQNIPLARTEQILTFDEVLDIAAEASVGRAEPIGVYVETKHPTYFAGIGLDLNDLLIEVLDRRQVNHRGAKIIIQSMETGNLRALRARTPLTLIQLLDRQGAPYDLVAARDPAHVPQADQEGRAGEDRRVRRRDRPQQEPRDPARRAVPAQRSDQARAQGPPVRPAGAHLDDAQREQLPADRPAHRQRQGRHGDAVAEYLAFFDAGVDGVFSDFTQTAVAARTSWVARRSTATTP